MQATTEAVSQFMPGEYPRVVVYGALCEECDTTYDWWAPPETMRAFPLPVEMPASSAREKSYCWDCYRAFGEDRQVNLALGPVIHSPEEEVSDGA